MRFYCYFCHKAVTSEVPWETVIRALLVCPECIEAGKIQVPEEADDGKDTLRSPL